MRPIRRAFRESPLSRCPLLPSDRSLVFLISRRYLAELAAKGWHVVDHHALETKDSMGVWGPTLADNVLLSFGKGFVGQFEQEIRAAPTCSV